MRILIVHNRYRQRGGEDAVVESEAALLRRHGYAVRLYTRDNDEIRDSGRLRLAADTLWSSRTYAEASAMLRDFRPDIIHVHNTFPLVSPSLYWAADRQRIPVVQTLHNFRLLCPQAMFLREGKVCEDCLGKPPWRGAARGCYRDSRSQSTVLAGMLASHAALGTWRNKVTRYIALSEFCRGKFIAGGLPAERIIVKPNFVDFEAPANVSRSGFLFVGRLSAEKGIDVLAAALASLPDTQLRVAGDGPDAALLDGVQGVTRLGRLPVDAVRQEMNAAVAVVVPSICFETFGMVVVEAFASGTPVIASRIGGLPDMVRGGETGLLFEPGDARDLARKLLWAKQHPEEMARMGRNARLEHERRYTAERNYALLMNIYEEAIDARRSTR